MTAQRALVARPGRKTHWAVLYPGASAWVPICDVAEIPVFGATPTGVEDWNAWLSAADHDDAGVLCLRCRRPLLAAARALEEQAGIRARVADVAALQDEVRSLRAEVSRWTTAALAETKRAGAVLRDHVLIRRPSVS